MHRKPNTVVSDVEKLIHVSTPYPSYWQCYGYGFVKIEDKRNKYFGAYVHPDFQRDDPTRACTIQRRSALGNDRRFKKSSPTVNTAARNHRIRPCGTNVNPYLDDSCSSLETWHSTGETLPNVRHDPDWHIGSPRAISVTPLDLILPYHVSSDDEWIEDLQLAFSSPCSHTALVPSNGMLSFAEFQLLLEPRPIELMIKK